VRPLRAPIAAILTGCAVLVGMVGVPGSASAAAQVTCTEADVPVSAVLLGQIMHGQLCSPASGGSKMVQVLLPGATFNRKYWDLPYEPDRYSYQRDMARNGLATFAVDELGVGQSSRPLSVLVTGAGQSSAVHQVVQALRVGKLGGTRFEKVVLVGHSAGSAIAVLEASAYHDVDGVVLTGMTHVPNAPVVIKDMALGLQPVTLDPQLAKRGGDPGYLTSRPGDRDEMYFSSTDVEPGVVQADEMVAKDQVSLSSLPEIIGLGLASPISRGISAPVLLVNGTKDTGFCGLVRDCSTAESLRAAESMYFGPAAKLSVYVLPGAGHAVALAENAPDYRDVTRGWLRQYVGV